MRPDPFRIKPVTSAPQKKSAYRLQACGILNTMKKRFFTYPGLCFLLAGAAVLVLLFASLFEKASESTVTGPAGAAAVLNAPAAVTIGDGYTLHSNGTVSNVKLSCPGGYDIFYTTDGSDPDQSSSRYDGPLTLKPEPPVLSVLENEKRPRTCFGMSTDGFPQAVILKAAAAGPEGTMGPVSVRTFFPGTDLDSLFPDTLVISLIADPEDLLDYDQGILCSGRIFDDWMRSPESHEILLKQEWWYVEANFAARGPLWERPASVEFFEPGLPDTPFQEPCGIRLHGRASRLLSQMSFNLYFRKEYGKTVLDYTVIPGIVSESDGKPVTTFKSLILSSGGNDAEWLKFRDALLHDIAGEIGLNVSRNSFRPAVLFLNGEYWGTYLLEDKLSRHYFADHYGVEKTNVIEFKNGELAEGSEPDRLCYEEYTGFADRDMSDPAVWEEFLRTVDISSMIDYYAYQIYINDHDWEQEKNTAMWRVRTPGNSSAWDDGRWRFELYDITYSAGLYGFEETGPQFDSFVYAQKNHPVFRAALQAPEFRRLLAERLTSLQEQLNYEYIAQNIDRYKEAYGPLAELCARRFCWYSPVVETEYGEITGDEYCLRSFFDERADFVNEFIIPEIRAYDG